MTPVLYIRKHVLRLTQEELGEKLGREQPTIHRWERAGYFPASIQARVRELGQAACENWSDSWFFEVPTLDAASIERAA